MNWQDWHGQIWTVDGQPFVVEYRKAKQSEAWLGETHPTNPAGVVATGRTNVEVLVLLPITKEGKARIRPATTRRVPDPRLSANGPQTKDGEA